MGRNFLDVILPGNQSKGLEVGKFVNQTFGRVDDVIGKGVTGASRFVNEQLDRVKPGKAIQDTTAPITEGLENLLTGLGDVGKGLGSGLEETGEGLGDLGKFLGIGLAVVIGIAAVIAAVIFLRRG